jgi:hypothetical protein
MLRLRAAPGFIVTVALATACGDSTDPDEVPYGETTFVVLLNPAINDANEVDVAAPGAARLGVGVAVEGGPTATTSADGVAVLSPVASGSRVLAFDGPDDGEVALSIVAGDLREVAVALDAAGAEVMADIRYEFGAAVVEISPAMTLAEVNAALAASNSVVFFAAGTYSGDITFSGSNVTLFGEGNTGGSVVIDGNVTVSGSQNRIRGARITGDLSVPASNFGMSFTRVDGTTDISGSSSVMLANAFCGTVTVSGSGATLLGNAGLAPIAAPSGC